MCFVPVCTCPCVLFLTKRFFPCVFEVYTSLTVETGSPGRKSLGLGVDCLVARAQTFNVRLDRNTVDTIPPAVLVAAWAGEKLAYRSVAALCIDGGQRSLICGIRYTEDMVRRPPHPRSTTIPYVVVTNCGTHVCEYTPITTVCLVCLLLQENMERHAILDSIDVMPEIYDILRHCEDSHLTPDEKSLLATQLAPHWTNSEEARRALETAVVYTEAEEEAEFWQGLQVCLRNTLY